MAFPTGWARKCAMVIDHTKVVADVVNFPVLLDATNVPTEMIDLDGSARANTDGSDIRISTDTAGATECPLEVVTCTMDNTPANSVLEIWTKIPAVSSAVDTTFYIWYKNASATAYAVTDTFGRNNVWTEDFLAVYHCNEGNLVDSTGNGYTGTDHGTADAAGKIGRGRDIVRADRDYIEVAGMFGTPAAITVSGWVDLHSADTEGAELISLGDNVILRLDETYNSGKMTGYFYSTDTWNETQGATAVFAGAGWSYAAYKYAASGNQKVYKNGVEDGATTYAAAMTYDSPNGTNTFIGRQVGVAANYDLDGVVDEIRVASVGRTTQWLRTEYYNQSGPSTFLTVGTPVDVGNWPLLQMKNEVYNSINTQLR